MQILLVAAILATTGSAAALGHGIYNAVAPKIQQGKGSRAPQTSQQLLEGLRKQTVNFPIIKNPTTNLAAGVCTESHGGLVVVSAENSTLYDGEAVCSQFGFQWAVVEQNNVYNLQETLKACNAAYVAIKSFNGYEGDTCQMSFIGEEFYADLPDLMCSQTNFLFLCQEIPFATTTVTSYTTVETKSETATVTDVVHPTSNGCDCPCCSSSSSSSTNCHKHDVEKSIRKTPKVDFSKKTKDDYKVCPKRHHGDIHFIKTETSWEEAHHACKCHGWKLLDVTEDNMEVMKKVYSKCDIIGPVWIRSWMGFKGGDCRATMPNSLPSEKKKRSPFWLSGLFMVEEMCEIAKMYVACQEERRQPATANGPVKIITLFTSTTTTVDQTLTSTITTVTTTVTLLDK